MINKVTIVNLQDENERLVLAEIGQHIDQAQHRYANFTSTHEALGVALEEWTELQDAIHSNQMESVRDEAIDLAAVLIRLAVQCRSNMTMRDRSAGKNTHWDADGYVAK